ncbi:MAG: helix-turn-helix transcriptional regulator [Sphingomonadales bacterium]|nr:helix-turn-helix transcriptional regulator [Sphingomonadales bacterium]
MNRPAQSLPDLTPKQRDVLALVADNRTSKEIAARLGISESAVNQRIEMVRSRLGGLPRGELARLYRQEFALTDGSDDADEETWQKIHLPEPGIRGKEPATESISLIGSVPYQASEAETGDGSQLSAFFFENEPAWLSSLGGRSGFAQHIAIAAIVIAALFIAVGVTQLIGPIGGR